MDRLFLDANVLFSAAYQPDSRMLQLWRLKRAKLLTSSYAIEEARRNLPRDDQRARLRELISSIEAISTVTPRPIPDGLPEKDRLILWAALASRATHLITGDFKHFGKFFGTKILGIEILPPADYLAARIRGRGKKPSQTS